MIIGVIVIYAVIFIPLIGFFTYQYFFPQKTVHFYVNNGKTSTSYTVSTSLATLDFFEAQPHPSHSSANFNYVATVIESYCTPNDENIIQIAYAISLKCIDQYDSEEEINALLSFTQGIDYYADTVDLAKYPLETIFKQGDCEDLSILFGSLVVSLGYEAIIVMIYYYMESLKEWFGHTCVGVYLNFTPTQHKNYPPSHSFTINSKDYWICEATGQGWMIGDLPASNPSYYIMRAYAFIN